MRQPHVCRRSSCSALQGRTQPARCWSAGAVAGGITGAAVISAAGVATVALASVSDGVAGFFAASSSCIAETSDLRIRSERPRPRAASGSLLAPKISTNAAMINSQCHQDNEPISTSIKSNIAVANHDPATSAARARAPTDPTVPECRGSPAVPGPQLSNSGHLVRFSSRCAGQPKTDLSGHTAAGARLYGASWPARFR